MNDQFNSNSKIIIRRGVITDSKFITILSTQLGYPSVETEIKNRLADVLKSPDSILLVAENGNKKVIGWIHAFIAIRVESKAFAEIGGLVIDENLRGMGAGSLLVKKAEEWAISKGINLMRVRSNLLRDETIKFYLKNEYKIIKTQNVFSKDISKRAAHE